MTLARLRPDNFTLALVATVVLATVLPARGGFAGVMEHLTTAAIVLLFFLHGAKLSRQAILQGLGAWWLHLTVFASTFVLFPVLGVLARAAPGPLIHPQVAAGVLFLCLLPSTVQSSIAFTSLAAVLMGAHGRGGDELKAVESVALELLAPFLAGHLLRPLIGGLVDRHKAVLGSVDRSSILFVVYT